MMNASHFQSFSKKLSQILTRGLLAVILCSSVLHGQEKPKSEPILSAATLEILEAQAQQNILETPTTKVPDETLLSTEKKKKIETGGLLKAWFAPFEKKSTNATQSPSTVKIKRKPLWSWFDPTAPVTKAESQAVPVDWKGSRKTPQSFGNRKRQEPEGLTLFFLSY